MPRTWEKIAGEDPIYNAEDYFADALYQIVTEQVLYQSDLRQRTSYEVIRRHIRDFREALALSKLELVINDDYRYCAAIHIELIFVDREFPQTREYLGCKGFVEFNEVNVINGQSSLFQGFLHGWNGP